jgi:hypothetical protein
MNGERSLNLIYFRRPKLAIDFIISVIREVDGNVRQLVGFMEFNGLEISSMTGQQLGKFFDSTTYNQLMGQKCR